MYLEFAEFGRNNLIEYLGFLSCLVAMNKFWLLASLQAHG